MAFTFPPTPTAVPPLLQVQFVIAGGDDAAGGIAAWQNPEPAPILVSLFDVKLSAPAAAACTVNAGGAATKTGLSVSHLWWASAFDAHTTPLPRFAGFASDSSGRYATTADGGSTSRCGLIALLDVGEWLVIETASGASAGLTGVVTIHYSPLP